ncbi:hypothetical protein BD779DRAFT_1672604 [Infundibulicybe gibba]|nr:hypothetical protein BD779DRAFT_1672604 [Infundibulicybe gibba]
MSAEDSDLSTTLSIDELRWLDATSTFISPDHRETAARRNSSPTTSMANQPPRAPAREIPRRQPPRRPRIKKEFILLEDLHEHDRHGRPSSPKAMSLPTSLIPSPELEVPPPVPPKQVSPAPAPSAPTAAKPAIAPPQATHHPEWIYRRPKSPARTKSAAIPPPSSPVPPARPQMHPRRRSRPQTGYGVGSSNAGHTHSRSVSQPHVQPASSSSSSIHSVASSLATPFWSAILRPRSRSDRSIPLLKTTPSPPVASPTQATRSKGIAHPSIPRHQQHTRTSSLTSTDSTTSTAPSSSRPSTPPTPSSPFTVPAPPPKEPHRYPVSQSCPPMRSILTRTASISTKNSASTANKSVKFVEVPVVYYPLWDLGDDGAMGIDVDGMEMGVLRDGSREALLIQREKEWEWARSTPTPEKIRLRAAQHQINQTPSQRSRDQTSSPPTSLKRLMSLTRSKPAPTDARRPSISGPFALGTCAPTSPAQLPARALRSAPSLESCRSGRSVGARSVRSLGSVRSSTSTRGFRAWLGRMGVGVGC